MHTLSVLTYDTTTVLGLRFRFDPAIEVTEIIGAGNRTESTVVVTAPQPETEFHYDLPSSVPLTEEELSIERSIHGLSNGRWLSARVQQVLSHQVKSTEADIELSALVALAALQERLQAPLVHLGEAATISIDENTVTVLPRGESAEIASGSVVCGAALTSAMLHGYGDTVKRLTFEDAGIQTGSSVTEHLRGLEHLFALAMGGAIFSSPSVTF